MYHNRHKSWLLTIVQVRSPFIFWGVLLTAFMIVALTFFFKPIYSATTVLTLDADLEKVLRNIQASYPSTSRDDFIRHEYFASHNVALMRNSLLAEGLVKKWNIRNSKNKVIAPEYFVEPSFFNLIFSNSGQGIRVKWISDTQQFSINGYSKDANRAVDYSNDYTKAFLKDNFNQFNDILNVLAERFDLQKGSVKVQIAELDSQIMKIYHDNKTASIETEIQSITNKLLGAEDDLENASFLEKNYKKQIQFLTKKLEKFGELNDYQRIMEANPRIQSLKADIYELTASLIKTSIDFTHEHPDYIAIERMLDNAKKVLKGEAKTIFYRETKQRSSTFDSVLDRILSENLNHLIYKSKVEYFKTKIKNYNTRLNTLIVAQVKISNLDIDKSAMKNLMLSAIKNRKIIENIMNKSLPFFRVVSPAHINMDLLKNYKYFPKRKVILALFFIVSLLVFSFFIIAKELYENTIYRGWQLSILDNNLDFTEIPNLEKNNKSDKHILENVFIQYIRQVYLATKNTHIIRIVSFHDKEGKATIARSLSLHCTKIGKSVIIIDSDFKYKSLTYSSNLNEHPGLSEYLLGQKKIDEIIVRKQPGGYHLIPSGKSSLSEDYSLDMKNIRSLLSMLTSKYEKIIIVDCPLNESLFMLEDIMPLHDIILSFNSGYHSLHKVERLIKQYRVSISIDKMKLKGIIINKIPFEFDIFNFEGVAQLTKHLILYPFKRYRK